MLNEQEINVAKINFMRYELENGMRELMGSFLQSMESIDNRMGYAIASLCLAKSSSILIAYISMDEKDWLRGVEAFHTKMLSYKKQLLFNGQEYFFKGGYRE